MTQSLVEQAVFTSAPSDQGGGYRLVAASPGVSTEDARALACWGPSHDSLLGTGPEALSISFHPLPTGGYCLGRTTCDGWEYSGRGGHRIYTQFFVVPADVLGRFANNPFALLRALVACGAVEVRAEIPESLPALSVAGRAAAIDQVLLARLAANPGPQWLAQLVRAALESPGLAIRSPLGVEPLVAGLMSCLPPECRTEFTFSTGLRFSTQRPFRIMAADDDGVQLRRMQQQGYRILEVAGDPPATSLDGWPRLIEHILTTGHIAFLATQMAKRRFELVPNDLPALSLQLLEELDATLLRSGQHPRRHERPREPADGFRQAHAPHARTEGASRPTETRPAHKAGPSARLDPNSPAVLQQLERLDDLVFEAIAGHTAALDELAQLWPNLREELGLELLAESREQYLRYALSIWEESNEAGGARSPIRAGRALEVLCVLFDEV